MKQFHPSFLKNRGVLTALFMVMLFYYGIAGGTLHHSMWYMNALLIPMSLIFAGNPKNILAENRWQICNSYFHH